ncbi:META domain-containing protein [Microbacterium sp. 18062]|uniref:META domain-containing protein n=1 Tax=Microbacterium sp. 18062 TaxID=2681410 RepID=UPI001356CBA0|nr:META domain-containing protein [Microbacterium sp. 18062]
MNARSTAVLVITTALILLTACASPGAGSPSSSGPESPVGTWGDPSSAHIVLAEDGSLSGSDGCNGLNGTYTADGATLTFSLGFSTLKGCIGVDTWLRGITTATIVDGTLVVYDDQSTQIGTLDRTTSSS